MVNVTIVVEQYPFEGATGIEVEKLTSYGWVSVLDTTEIGTFPDYTTNYEVTGLLPNQSLRYRWVLGGSSSTQWLAPRDTISTPTDEQVAQITQGIIAKATRLLVLPDSPLGVAGEFTELGSIAVRPDYQIKEILYGLQFRNWATDLTALVTTDDVIRVGLSQDPTDFPAAKVPDVQRAIDAACAWVATYLLEGVGIA